MKSTFSAAVALSLLGIAAANPVPWTAASPRSALAERMDADSVMAARSLSQDPAAFAQKTYDYIVVGAGTAGLAVAARLSEDGSSTVGVLEAGGSGFGVGIIDIPGQFGADLATIYDWNYTTAAGTGSAAGVPSIPWPRGKLLGGSSALNFLVWDRASEVEYDAWEKLGSPGWNWKNLYHYMKKSEEFTAPPASDAEKLHIAPNSSDYGSSGPVKVSFPRYVSEQVQNWIPALQSLGIPKNDDPLAGNNVGASVQPSNIDPYNSTRSYSAPAYLFPNAARPNLAVQTDALVTKINFAPALSSKADLKATGISFVSGSKTYTVKVNKEVIVAGGSVNTPAILEHSGIGNKTILAKAGVKQLIDLPAVGENLQDHSYSSAAYELKDGHVTLDTLRNNATFAREQTDLYKANKTSILDETVPAIAYVSLPKLVGNETADQLIAEAAAYVEQSTAPYKATLQMQIDYLQNHPDTVSQMELIGIDGYFATSGAPVPNKTYITYLAAQQHLLSRGTVHINSSDATVYPVISPNYYSVPFDVKVATAGTAYMRKIAGAEQYASYIAKEAVPGEGADLQNYTTTVGFTTEYHPIGTASMLPRNKGGVVDPTLKVYGTCNVRVVDASIIPVHISAHIQATVYGVAEFAADIIRGKSIL